MKFSRYIRPNAFQANQESSLKEDKKTPFFSKKGENDAAFFNYHGLQTKLDLGQPGDTYELEADAMADQVVQNQPAVPGIQKKCESCQQEEQKSEEETVDQPVQMKAMPAEKTNADNPASIADQDIENNLQSERGNGSPLSNTTRTKMESSFGSDFSNVRIHTSYQANQMNQNLQAQAFTHGNDIYFNQGKYQPDSKDGRHLLAHELTHVVQQTGKIQKAVDPELRVEGKFSGAAADPDSVYFDYSSGAVDSDEEAKISTLVSANTSQDFNLIGFSSEEGSDTGNRLITNQRLIAVDRIMVAEGHTGTRNKKNQFQRAANRLDYRQLRRVDIVPNAVPSTEPDCSITPVESCGTSFTNAFPIALQHAILAFNKMLIAPVIPVEKTRIENAVAAFFGDAIHYDTVKTHLGNLVFQIADQPNTVSCHNACDNTCRQATAYMDGSTGSGAKLTLCSPFYHNTNVRSNAETLVHEALHATSGLATEDLAYGSERGITFLDSATALKNTDSYVLFMQELILPGSVLGGGGGNRDIIDSAITGTQLSNLRRVMAYLEKWIIESTAETSGLYDILVEVRGAGTWSGVTYPYYEDTMSFLAPLFGLTAPATVPDENDQVAVAGIFDRLLRMDELLWGTDINIKKDAGAVRFAPGPDDPLFVNDAFLTSTQHAMVYLLIEKLVAANTSISSSHKPKYVTLVEKIREHAGHSAP